MTTILTKKKDTSGAPATADITSSVGGAELAVNTADKRLYTKDSSNDIVEVGTNPASLNLNADLTNTSGNLTVDPATKIFEIKGGGSTDGQIKLNCRSNSHGQTLKSQDHSAGITNTMLLPRGADSTLVSEVGTATVTNKTLDAIVSVSASGALNIGGAITGSSTVSDQDGDLRNLQISHSGKATYTLTTNDTGQMVRLDSAGIGALIPSATFAVGDIISVMNTTSTTGSITSQITMHVGGAAASTGTATLGINNIANIYFVSADGCIVTGGVT